MRVIEVAIGPGRVPGSVREVGRQLLSALLGTGQVAGVYRASTALASDRGEDLRLELRIDDPMLAGLPWGGHE